MLSEVSQTEHLEGARGELTRMSQKMQDFEVASAAGAGVAGTGL